MKTWIRALEWTGRTTAIGSVTVTPLMGFLVGDKKPSIEATALQMLIAVVLLSAALAATLLDERKRATEIYRRAAARGAGWDPDDRFAVARKQAHDAGLPWIEADGTVSRPADLPAVEVRR